MNREKQIEEIKRTLYKAKGVFVVKDAAQIVAETLYDAGYRKQKEGEWIKSKSGLYVCSECDKTCPYDAQADVISYWECKYCPNCGAKMNRGEK